MRDFLVSQGVPQDRVIVEDRSTSTRENARYTKELLSGMAAGPAWPVLLTSDYHMFRAERVFRKTGSAGRSFLSFAERP